MTKLFKILFSISLLSSTLLAISSFSWFIAWIGLEINLLSIIPLLKNHKNTYPSESALKYFIVQAMASSLLIFTMTFFFILDNSISEKAKIVEIMLMSTALLLKMGAAPFHFWLPEVISGLNWNNIFIMLTWQKIAPMVLLTYQIKNHTLFFSIIIITSTIISGIQGFNQVCLRKILAYSSINHLSWMISSLLNSTNVCLYYFLVYCLINLNIILIFKKFNIIYLIQLVNIFSYNKKMKFFFMMNFMSLGGLPPFLGFFPKWLTINNMIYTNHYFLTGILIIFTLISLYIYLRITFASFTVYSKESLIILFNKNNYFYFMMNLFSLMGLIMCNFMDSFF